MRILCVIDHFGSGGAQRQMVNLACGLKARGHEIELFNYFPQHSFFRPQIDAAKIPVHEVRKGKGFSFAVLFRLAKLLRSRRYDAAISFLETPNTYLELASFVARPPILIASERNTHHGDGKPWRSRLHRRLHRRADAVVANSAAHACWLEERHEWLRGKVRVVRNGIDVAAFSKEFDPPASPHDLRLVAIGRIAPQKNVLGLIKAMRIFLDRNGWVPQTSWIGRRSSADPNDLAYFRKIDDALAAEPEIGNHLVFLGERSDVPALISAHHALILPSFYEGLPNVVCEALAGGRPVIASDVSDVAALVEEGRRGFLFDPDEPETIAGAMERLAGLSPEQWRAFSSACAAYAAENLSENTMVDGFERVLQEMKSSKDGRR